MLSKCDVNRKYIDRDPISVLIYRYRAVVDEWFVYDNSELKTPVLVAKGRGAVENIIGEQKWQRLLKLAKTNER